MVDKFSTSFNLLKVNFNYVEIYKIKKHKPEGQIGSEIIELYFDWHNTKNDTHNSTLTER